MTGTKTGAQKMKATNLAKDPNYYSKIGTLGGGTTTKKTAERGYGSKKVGTDGLTGVQRAKSKKVKDVK